jgi:hypothetical protein
MSEHQKPMSIEQAGNFLEDKKKTVAEDMKQEAKKAPISCADIKDRISFLVYGVSLFHDVTETEKNTWCQITGKSPSLYSTREVALNLKRLVVLRINGYTAKAVAHHLKTLPEVIEKCEELAVKAIKRAIETKQNTGIPIIGGVQC